MFTRISFENYRAFRRGSIRIAPITILVGANSIGKSSILQLPLLFKQTLDQADHKYRAALKIHGKDVSFGNARQVFHDQNTNNRINVRFDFLDETLYELLRSQVAEKLSDVYDELLQNSYYIIRMDQKSTPKDISQKIRVAYEQRSSGRQRISDYNLAADLIKLTSNRTGEKGDIRYLFHRSLSNIGQLTATDFELTKDFVEKLKTIRSQSFRVRTHNQ